MKIKIGNFYKVKKKKNGDLKVVQRTNEEVSNMFGRKKKTAYEQYVETKKKRIAIERKNAMNKQVRDEKSKLLAAKKESFKNSAFGKIVGVSAKFADGVGAEVGVGKVQKKKGKRKKRTVNYDNDYLASFGH